ncbi:MAG: AI-2E family transporter [Eubacteriales bacterium]
MTDFENKKKLLSSVFMYFLAILLIIIIANHEVISGFIMSYILSPLSPIIIGFAMAYLLNPILNFHENKLLVKMKSAKARRGVGVLLTYVTLLVILVGFAFLIIPQLVKSIQNLILKLDEYIASTTGLIDDLLGKLSDMGVLSESVDSQYVIDAVSDVFTFSGDMMSTVFGFITKNIGNILNVPKNILLAIFISIYVLLAKDRLRAGLKKVMSAVFKEKVMGRIEKRIVYTHDTFGGYFTGVIIDAITVGVLTFIFLMIFRVPYAVLVATVVAVTNVIPIFGPFIGAIPSAFIIFISEPKKALIFLIIILIVQQIDGNIIAPKILGNSTGISSLGVIVAITIMGAYFGFVGMLIGVPVFAVIIGIINESIEARLSAKGLATELTDYYSPDAIIRGSEKHVTLAERLFEAPKALINKIKKKISEKKKEDDFNGRNK